MGPSNKEFTRPVKKIFLSDTMAWQRDAFAGPQAAKAVVEPCPQLVSVGQAPSFLKPTCLLVPPSETRKANTSTTLHNILLMKAPNPTCCSTTQQLKYYLFQKAGALKATAAFVELSDSFFLPCVGIQRQDSDLTKAVRVR